MVRAVTNFGRSGLSDWVVQRVSGIVLLIYGIVVGGYLLFNAGDLHYEQWRAFFEPVAMRAFSTAAILSVVAHAWIGLWSVSTDYLTERALGPKGIVLRLLFQALCAVLLFTYLVWGLWVVWSL